jgi:hypothetical protein
MSQTEREHCRECGKIREDLSDGFCRHCGTGWRTANPSFVPQRPIPAPATSGASIHEESEGVRRTRSAMSRLLRPAAAPLLALCIVGAFMAADRLWLHVYTPDVSTLKSQLRSTQNTESRDYLDLQNRVSAVDKNVQNAVNTQPTQSTPDTNQFIRDFRIANAVTVLSLVSNLGGSQSSNSAAGKACSAWLMSGTGSITDCGFQHAD